MVVLSFLMCMVLQVVCHQAPECVPPHGFGLAEAWPCLGLFSGGGLAGRFVVAGGWVCDPVLRHSRLLRGGCACCRGYGCGQHGNRLSIRALFAVCCTLPQAVHLPCFGYEAQKTAGAKPEEDPAKQHLLQSVTASEEEH